MIEELGNPFKAEGMDLVVLDTKEMACGFEQFQVFTRECLVERTKPIYDAIRRNELKVFSASTPRSVSKAKQQVASLKNGLQLSHSCT